MGGAAEAYNARGVPEFSLDPYRQSPLRGRVLALDVGARRIGVAVTDPLGITAQGLDTIQRKNKRTDFAQLESVIQKYEVTELVVGYPLRLNGEIGIQAEKMTLFAEELKKKFPIPVHLFDGRLTSTEANRILRESEISIEKRAAAVDRMAAVLILQAWMETRNWRESSPDP